MRRITRVLEGAGYQVLHAHDGVQALEIADRHREEIALAIVDLLLPNRSGFEVIGRLSERAPQVRLLATSGVYKEPYLEAAVSCGAHVAIPKPATDAEWLHALSSAMGSTAA